MRVPSMRRHKTGVFFVRHKGKDTYFSLDEAASRRAYEQWLQGTWARTAAEPASSSQPSLVRIADAYLEYVYRTRGKKLSQDYRAYLQPLMRYGGGPEVGLLLRPQDVNVALLDALGIDMISAGYKPRTVNHTLKAIKRMLMWAADRDMINEPPRLRRLPTVPVPKPTPKVLCARNARNWVAEAAIKDERLVPWLSLIYLSCLRPSEAASLAHDRGEWIEEGVYAIRGKTTGSTGDYRYMVFSDEGLEHVSALRPCWKTWDGMSRRCRTLCSYGGPRQLRSWGATHLRRAGVPLPTVRCVLGHGDGGAVDHYLERGFAEARSALRRITLR